MTAQTNEGGAFEPRAITRPDRSLLTYYVLVSLLTGPAFPFVFIPHWIKFATLRYELDDEGVSMSWGFLFRKEILLTYRRIQDIHVRRNLFHRWLGLAAVAIQTASGASGAEMTMEGILQPERLRDYLYRQMRGARGAAQEGAAEDDDHAAGGAEDRALALLEAIRDDLRAMRQARGGGGAGVGGVL